MSLFSRLFGSGVASAPEPQPEIYKGFAITPTPIREGSRYRLSARIVPEGGGGEGETIIRADTFEDLDAATAASVRKAKQVVDEQHARGRGPAASP